MSMIASPAELQEIRWPRKTRAEARVAAGDGLLRRERSRLVGGHDRGDGLGQASPQKNWRHPGKGVPLVVRKLSSPGNH